MNIKGLIRAALAAGMFAAPMAMAETMHPQMDSTYWANLGIFFAARDFDASAQGGADGDDREIDFESAVGVKDEPELFVGEFGWQFGEKWGLAVQYFRSQRSGRATLEDSVEWQGVTYDIGVDIRAETEIGITRFVMSRQFRDKGPHSLQLAAGFHYLDLGASIAGEASINETETGFRKASASASAPVPNLGVWYRYSASPKWLLYARLDWLSAKVDDIGGQIWNVAAGANYSLNDHLGVGLTYQFFQLDGSVTETRWRGNLKTSFSGPNLYISGYW